MRKVFVLIITLSSLYGAPSEDAINASLTSIGSEESYDDINPLHNVRETYATSYNYHMKRYQVTKEEHAKIAKQFEEANIPLYFSLIPYCESNFRNDAHGSGAVGLWQFMKQSGRTYGLTIKKGHDERTNICLSTEAAIRYIKDLKKEFGEWYLADFAYGLGEIKLKRLIKKNGSNKISVLLKDPEFKRGTKDHFIKTLLLDATIHQNEIKEDSTVPPEPIQG
ncbi:MAG: lytic transglycosylase domain-containing protein [Sulfuricurvum sp.]|uniref:lytic transglycosylase domain-containing protein n=1 Tax=Sulfuricurvum sp. TaxID=2025608 RepID=UPI002616E9FD|nr:lytic transglycosylase domain-containing protein [Sulfuricurvum sp.]MDD2829693.1 lytic transglycosylase domain-containing protein [Sulfuricurvum sp.]MDD4950135.1 lytic transglycosylase domain-containing protein [Sulfuricurvum sp.]